MHHDEVIRLLLDRRGILLGYIATMLPDRAAAEDIFQETLIKASSEATHFDHPGHAMAWVRGTARNLALNEARKAHRRMVVLDDDVLDLLDRQWEAYDRDDDARGEFKRLEHCLDQLSPHARNLIRLRYTEGLDCQTVANRKGKTLNTIHVTLSRIYKTLAECVGGKGAVA